MATIDVNAVLILDESTGSQDDDTAYANLNADFRLYLSTNYATAVPIESALQLAMVSVTPDANEIISALIFSKPDGSLFNGEQAKEADGTAIQTWDSNGDLVNVYLYSVATDPDIVLAKTSGGDLVAAFYLNDAPSNLAASVEMVAYKPLYHEDPTKADADYLDWGELLSVTAQGSLSFNFDTLESGKFLWVAVGDDEQGLLVTGRHPAVDQATGDPLTGKNGGDMVNTSQGGAGATIGIDNQMMTPGDVATLTLVTGYTGLGDGPHATGQNMNEIQYSGYINTNEAGMFISQKQGSGLLTFSMSILEAGGVDGTNPEQQGGYDDGLAVDGEIPIAMVKIGNVVWTAAGAGSDLAFGEAVSPGGLKVELTDANTIRVLNADVGQTVMITAAAGQTYNRIELAPEVGKFDIGRIDVSQGNRTTVLVGDQIMTDDDGPTLSGTIQILVDEDDLDETDADGDLSTGIVDVDSVTDEASITDAALAALVTGRDQPAVFALALSADLDGDAVLGTDGFPVYSQGDAVAYNINGNVIEGVADGRVVFTLSRNGADDGWEFDLLDQIDHADASGDSGYRDIDLSRAFIVTDFDLDPGSLTGRISARVENDVPAAVQDATAAHEVMEDALTGGNADGDLETETASAVYSSTDLNALVTEGADEDLAFDLDADVIGDAVLDSNGDPLMSNGVAVLWAAGAVAGTLAGKAGTRTVFTLVDNGNGSFTATLTDQIDHSQIDDDQELLAINLTPSFVALDFDKDPATLGANSILLRVENDVPFIDAQIQDADVNFAAGSSAGPVSLNGSVGADEDASYYFTDWDALDGYTIRLDDEDRPTLIEYMKGNVVWFDCALAQTGDGSYTFNSYMDAPMESTDFEFTYMPSGQSLFGVLVDEENGVQDLDGLGLLVVGRDAGLDPASGKYTNASNTINTSQGGGNVTIGVNNQMFDPLEGAVFVYLNNPDDKSIAPNPLNTTGLTQTTADDADACGFASTQGAMGGEVEVVQKQGGGQLGMKLTAYDVVVPGGDGGIVSAADPLQSDPNVSPDSSANARAFLDNPLAGAATESIIAVQVYDTVTGTLLEAVELQANGTALNVDFDGNGTVDNSAGITITFSSISGGTNDYSATVVGFGATDTIAFQTDALHDAVLVENTKGKWDVGGFNISQGVDTPDQLLDFSVGITDADDDDGSGLVSGYEDFSILIDGTGQYDNGVYDDPNALLTLAVDLETLSLRATDRAEAIVMHDQFY